MIKKKIKSQGVLRVIWPIVNRGQSSQHWPSTGSGGTLDSREQRDELINGRPCSWGFLIPLYVLNPPLDSTTLDPGAMSWEGKARTKRQRSRRNPHLCLPPQTSLPATRWALTSVWGGTFHYIFLPFRQIGQAGCHFLLDRARPRPQRTEPDSSALGGEHFHPQIHLVDVVCGQVGLVPVLVKRRITCSTQRPPEAERQGASRLRTSDGKRPTNTEWM